MCFYKKKSPAPLMGRPVVGIMLVTFAALGFCGTVSVIKKKLRNKQLGQKITQAAGQVVKEVQNEVKSCLCNSQGEQSEWQNQSQTASSSSGDQSNGSSSHNSATTQDSASQTAQEGY